MQSSTVKIKPLDIFLVIFILMPNYFSFFGFEANRILTIGFVLLWIVSHRERRIKTSGISLLAPAIWGLTRVISYIANDEYTRAIIFLFMFFGVGYVVISWVTTKERFYHIIDLIIGCGVFAALLGIVEEITGLNFFALFNTSGVSLNYNDARLGLIRIISYTSQTITYCLCCSIYCCLIFYRLYTTKSKKKIRYLKIAYVLEALNMVLTLSRSILIIFLGIQLILLFKVGARKFIKRVVIAALIILPLLFTFTSIFSVGDDNLIMQIIYMLLAVFDSDFAAKLSSNWGREDKSGLGNRLQLYGWVWLQARNRLAFGYGEKSIFSHIYHVGGWQYGYDINKQSIEVNYLYLLYHYGIFATIAEVYMYIKICVRSWIKARKRHFENEDTINFNYTVYIFILIMLISWLGVMQGREYAVIYLLIFLYVAYNNILSSKAEAE